MPALEAEGDLSEGLPANSGVCGQLCSYLLREVQEVVTTTIGDHNLTPPNICLLLVGRHPAAISYASSTVAAARAAGVSLVVQRLPENSTNAEVANRIALANAEPSCHGRPHPSRAKIGGAATSRRAARPLHKQPPDACPRRLTARRAPRDVHERVSPPVRAGARVLISLVLPGRSR